MFLIAFVSTMIGLTQIIQQAREYIQGLQNMLQQLPINLHPPQNPPQQLPPIHQQPAPQQLRRSTRNRRQPVRLNIANF